MDNQIKTNHVSIPEIMTANCFYWHPNSNASGRRQNEKRRNEEVENFIASNSAALAAAEIEIDFKYSETCHHVYKHCKITRAGKKSNITAVRKALSL